MSEPGGSTTQSGIFYQNTVAALFLGRLCDARPRPERERVVSVRVEAPEDVDDTVVTFADGYIHYIQAKESIRYSDKDLWATLWGHFDNQYERPYFRRGRERDRLVLQIGSFHTDHNNLLKACDRARGSDNFDEWSSRLTAPQRNLVDNIRPLLQSIPTDTGILEFFKHVHIVIAPLEVLERDLVPLWIPTSNFSIDTVFRLLRDRIGGRARIKERFTARPLRLELTLRHRILFEVPPDIEDLQEAVRACGARLRQHKHTLAQTGKHLTRSIVGDIVSHLVTEASSPEEQVCLLLDGAGTGKTVVMYNVLCELERLGVITLAIKADLQLSTIANFGGLQSELRLPQAPEEVVARLATLGPVVVIIDQIDALSLSLARDQKALDIVLELVARLRLIPGVRFLLSCRKFDRNSDPSLRQMQSGHEFSLQPLSDVEITEALDLVDVRLGDLTPATQQLLRSPLNLDLFLRVLQGENGPARTASAQGLTTLQALYTRVWNTIVCKLDPQAPPVKDREEVLRLLTRSMNARQRTTAPMALFNGANSGLQPAVRWLASEGILIEGERSWGFLHQTFFDFCYAKEFVESGQSLSETILNSEQGTFARPQMRQVLAYLRDADPDAYIQEVLALLDAPNLRFHLRDLLMRWLGQQPSPTDDEWIVVQRLLIDPDTRPEMLRVIGSNAGWFARMTGAVEAEEIRF